MFTMLAAADVVGIVLLVNFMTRLQKRDLLFGNSKDSSLHWIWIVNKFDFLLPNNQIVYLFNL